MMSMAARSGTRAFGILDDEGLGREDRLKTGSLRGVAKRDICIDQGWATAEVLGRARAISAKSSCHPGPNITGRGLLALKVTSVLAICGRDSRLKLMVHVPGMGHRARTVNLRTWVLKLSLGEP